MAPSYPQQLPPSHHSWHRSRPTQRPFHTISRVSSCVNGSCFTLFDSHTTLCFSSPLRVDGISTLRIAEKLFNRHLVFHLLLLMCSLSSSFLASFTTFFFSHVDRFRVKELHHEVVDGCTDHGADVRKNPRDPEEVGAGREHFRSEAGGKGQETSGK